MSGFNKVFNLATNVASSSTKQAGFNKTLGIRANANPTRTAIEPKAEERESSHESKKIEPPQRSGN